MSLSYTVRALADFSIFTAKTRKPNPFRNSYVDTLKVLAEEVELLGGHNVVFELGIDPSDIRLDGAPRAKAHVWHPGIRVSFESDQGPLSFATDRFEARWSTDPASWQINLRAIALGLEALRKVDRYGIAEGRQYAGWKALGAGGGATPMGAAPVMTRDEAWATILSVGRLADMKVSVSPETAYRSARKHAHPDRNGGDQTAWDQVEEAARVLGLTS